MTSPFNWQGQPSAFTTHDFNGVNHNKAMNAAKNSSKASPIVLPGASKYLPPKMLKKPK